MHGEAEKGLIEIAIFDEFAKALSLKLVDGSVEKIDPGVFPKIKMPDIYCELEEGPVYYELTEACDPELIKAIKAIEESGTSEEEGCAPEFCKNDASEDTLRKKLNKQYDIDAPVELIVYTNGRTVLDDDEISLRIRETVKTLGFGQFRKVWFFGRNTIMQMPEGVFFSKG